VFYAIDFVASLGVLLRRLFTVSILSEKLLIPYKARAWLDLKARKAAGEKIDANNIKKHRNDVFRLLQLLTQDCKPAFAASLLKQLTQR